MDERVQTLPLNLQEHIQSYLYFSEHVAKKMKVVNYMIERYVSFLMDEFKYVFHNRVATLYFRLMKFLYKNRNIYEKVKKNNVIIGIESSGAHSNGYSLINKLIKESDLSKSLVMSISSANMSAILEIRSDD